MRELLFCTETYVIQCYDTTRQIWYANDRADTKRGAKKKRSQWSKKYPRLNWRIIRRLVMEEVIA